MVNIAPASMDSVDYTVNALAKKNPYNHTNSDSTARTSESRNSKDFRSYLKDQSNIDQPPKSNERAANQQTQASQPEPLRRGPENYDRNNSNRNTDNRPLANNRNAQKRSSGAARSNVVKDSVGSKESMQGAHNLDNKGTTTMNGHISQVPGQTNLDGKAVKGADNEGSAEPMAESPTVNTGQTVQDNTIVFLSSPYVLPAMALAGMGIAGVAMGNPGAQTSVPGQVMTNGLNGNSMANIGPAIADSSLTVGTPGLGNLNNAFTRKVPTNPDSVVFNSILTNPKILAAKASVAKGPEPLFVNQKAVEENLKAGTIFQTPIVDETVLQKRLAGVAGLETVNLDSAEIGANTLANGPATTAIPSFQSNSTQDQSMNNGGNMGGNSNSNNTANSHQPIVDKARISKYDTPLIATGTTVALTQPNADNADFTLVNAANTQTFHSNVELLQRTGGERFVMQLKPEGLGQLEFRLLRQDGHLTAEIRVEDQTLARDLARDLKKIHTSLENQGLKIDDFKILIKEPNPNNSGHGANFAYSDGHGTHSQQNFGQGSSQSTRPAPSNTPSEDRNGEMKESARVGDPNQLVDLKA